MVINVPVSEARKNLSAILKELQKDPSKIYQISINEIIVGELRYPGSAPAKDETSLKLKVLKNILAKSQKKKKKKTNIAAEHDKYIYNL